MERLTEKGKQYQWFDFEDDGIDIVMEKLQKIEDLEEQIGMPLEELFEQHQLYQQAFYLACWRLAEFDDKGKYDEMEASDEWKEIIMKEAEKKLEEAKNEN